MVQILVQTPLPAVLNDCRLTLPRVVVAGPSVVAAPTVALRAHPALRTLELDAEHVVAFVPSLSHIAVLNRPALALLRRLPLADPTEISGSLATLANLGLLVAVDADGAIPPPPAPTTLVAWLHITNACNLRCSYCYIAKSAEAMAPTTARAAVDAVIAAAQRHGYSEIALKYAGGEPLLALDTVLATHRYARERCAAAGLGLQATVLTNGTALTAERAARLSDLGLAVTISLDGFGATNDQQRPTGSGGGSAAAVFAGINAALRGGLTPAVALTVTRASLKAAPALVAWLLAQGLAFTISFYREPTGQQSGDELALEATELIAGMRAVYATVAANPPPWSVLGALLDHADLSHAHGRACAAGEHALVIDHHGRVAACQMVLAQPRATLADADPLGAIRRDPHLPLGLHVDAKADCQACAWRYWCGGGCPLVTLRATGRTDVRSPNCALYQALYPDLIRLEGYRLLHQGH